MYKLIFIFIFGLIGYAHPPFETSQLNGAVIGASFALALSILAIKIKKTELRYLWSSTIGILLGVLVGWSFFLMFKMVVISFSSYIFFKILFLFGFPITGLFIGIHKPNMFAPLNIREFFRGSSAFTDSFLIDTSAIIDGRIVPIALS